MPVYNEEGIIEESIKELIAKLNSAFQKNYEMIIVENGSDDKTPKLLKKLSREYSIRVIKYPKADLGKALRLGFLESKGNYFSNCAADWYDIDFVKKAIYYLREYDCVLGNKFMNKRDDKRGIIRKLISWGYNSLLWVLFQPKSEDTHAINIYSEKVKPVVKLCKTSGSLFPTELVLRCERKKLKIKTLPIEVMEKRRARKSIMLRSIMALRGAIKLKIILQKDKMF